MLIALIPHQAREGALLRRVPEIARLHRTASRTIFVFLLQTLLIHFLLQLPPLILVLLRQLGKSSLLLNLVRNLRPRRASRLTGGRLRRRTASFRCSSWRRLLGRLFEYLIVLFIV